MVIAEAHRQYLFPRIAVGTTVVSVCRAMLSIRSLAATHHVDPEWLLNHAELSRVQWRRGANKGEIIVEINEIDLVFPSKTMASPAGKTGYEKSFNLHFPRSPHAC